MVVYYSFQLTTRHALVFLIFISLPYATPISAFYLTSPSEVPFELFLCPHCFLKKKKKKVYRNLLQLLACQSLLSPKSTKSSLWINPIDNFLFSYLNVLWCLPRLTVSSFNFFLLKPMTTHSFSFLYQYRCSLTLTIRDSFYLPIP